jgi:hypothetical protein
MAAGKVCAVCLLNLPHLVCAFYVFHVLKNMSELTSIICTGEKRNVGEDRAIIGSHISRRLSYQTQKSTHNLPTFASRRYDHSCTPLDQSTRLLVEDDLRQPHPPLQRKFWEQVSYFGPSNPYEENEDEFFLPQAVETRIHPDTLVKQGNSDPLHSFNFEIDATVVGPSEIRHQLFDPVVSFTIGGFAAYVSCTPFMLSGDLCKGYGYLVSPSIEK